MFITLTVILSPRRICGRSPSKKVSYITFDTATPCRSFTPFRMTINHVNINLPRLSCLKYKLDFFDEFDGAGEKVLLCKP